MGPVRQMEPTGVQRALFGCVKAYKSLITRTAPRPLRSVAPSSSSSSPGFMAL